MVWPMEIEAAEPADLPAIRALVRSCGLQDEDIGLPDQRYLVARDGERLVGCIGLEIHGTSGLLRSFAVEPSSRHRGVGRTLQAAALDVARAEGVRDLYILTTTVRDRALRDGFEDVPRERVPGSIRAGTQFRGLCPATASCMHLRLP